jgi:hypothetical protein
MVKWLVCGSRMKTHYKDVVFKELDSCIEIFKDKEKGKPEVIITGACPNSADEYAEEWAKNNGVRIMSFPSTAGNYLMRNIEMINTLNANNGVVFAFWDQYSHGTCHTIAHAMRKKIPVIIIDIKEETKWKTTTL